MITNNETTENLMRKLHSWLINKLCIKTRGIWHDSYSQQSTIFLTEMTKKNPINVFIYEKEGGL